MQLFLILLREQNPLLFYFGLVCGLFALGCLWLTQRSQALVMGANAWYKPFKFFLSTIIFVWSMGWYLRYLADSQSAITAYSWGMVILFTLEDGYILIQAARGQRSHFNSSTLWYARMYAFMALAAVGISLWTAYIGIRFFEQDLAMLPVAYKWSIRWGLLLFVIFSMEGLAMGSRQRHTIGSADDGPGLPVVNWSTQYGDLRIAHFVGMHALQVVPLLGYYLLRSAWSAGLTALLYGSLATFLFVRALQAKPLFRFAN
jgi:hypothetical protein